MCRTPRPPHSLSVSLTAPDPERMKVALCVPLAAALALCACSGTAPKPAYRAETFDQETPFQRHYDADATRTCEAARRGLLSQGYIVTSAQATALKAEKSFQPEAEDHIVLQFNVMCVPATQGSATYASVVQSHYQVKKSASAASVGVSAIGSISLPWTSTNTDSMIRVGGETISDEHFYRRFFDLVARIIPDVPETPAPAPAPAPVVAQPQPLPSLIETAPRSAPQLAPATTEQAAGAPQAAPSGEPDAAPQAAPPAPATGSDATASTPPNAGSGTTTASAPASSSTPPP